MRTRFQLNPKGVAQLLTSPEIKGELRSRANAVAAAAGPGHDVKDTTTNRGRYTVATTTIEAMEAEATGHALTRALNAGRG
jgi:hypothetical protein